MISGDILAVYKSMIRILPVNTEIAVHRRGENKDMGLFTSSGDRVEKWSRNIEEMQDMSAEEKEKIQQTAAAKISGFMLASVLAFIYQIYRGIQEYIPLLSNAMKSDPGQKMGEISLCLLAVFIFLSILLLLFIKRLLRRPMMKREAKEFLYGKNIIISLSASIILYFSGIFIGAFCGGFITAFVIRFLESALHI